MVDIHNKVVVTHNKEEVDIPSKEVAAIPNKEVLAIRLRALIPRVAGVPPVVTHSLRLSLIQPLKMVPVLNFNSYAIRIQSETW